MPSPDQPATGVAAAFSALGAAQAWLSFRDLPAHMLCQIRTPELSYAIEMDTQARELPTFMPGQQHPECSDDAGPGPSELELSRAARRGDAAAVLRLLGRGVDVNARDNLGQTALFKAAMAGHIYIVAELLLAKADLLESTCAGRSVLEAAANERVRVMMQAMAPPSAGQVADVWMLQEALEELPDHTRQEFLLATGNCVRVLVM
mmetsp:Transcript_61408/g.170266  ORF Transcript_61408/g.170266 Transcript_61408/m.170266 type:complete len:205 (+) Transcript_61408:98-712(+)